MSGRRLGRAGLAFLAADDLVAVLDALALVRLGRPELADAGGGHAHQVLVGPADRDLGLLGVDLGGDPLGELEDHRVGEAEDEVDFLALGLGLEAHPDDVERALVALGDAVDGVAHQGARQAVEGAGQRGLVGAEDLHLALVHLELHQRVGA